MLNFKSQMRVAAAFIATAVMLLAAGLVTAAPAYAQGPTPTPSAHAGLRDRVREIQFKREQALFRIQAKHLADANIVATMTQNYIDAQTALGKDTSALAIALATFKAQIATAQILNDAAGSLVTAHAGFDANGTVVELAQAVQTVKDVRQPLFKAHQTLRQAVVDLRAAIRKYRNPNSTAAGQA